MGRGMQGKMRYPHDFLQVPHHATYLRVFLGSRLPAKVNMGADKDCLASRCKGKKEIEKGEKLSDIQESERGISGGRENKMSSTCNSKLSFNLCVFYFN